VENSKNLLRPIHTATSLSIGVMPTETTKQGLNFRVVITRLKR